jgi:hypothetical protein
MVMWIRCTANPVGASLFLAVYNQDSMFKLLLLNKRDNLFFLLVVMVMWIRCTVNPVGASLFLAVYDQDSMVTTVLTCYWLDVFQLEYMFCHLKYDYVPLITGMC